MFDAIFNALKTFFLWILDALVSMGRGIINLMLGLIPHDATTALGSAGSSIAWFLDAVNGWIPIDIGTTFFTLWLAWVATAALVRFCRQLIP